MSTLATIDYVIIASFIVLALAIGALFFKSAGEGMESFFLGGRKFPWWLAGTSIVATTFAADTPLAVAGIVAADGISGNWIWWCWAIAHLSATFFFARLWRRSEVITDAEITELRYGGKLAPALRGFKAIYFGIFINCMTMAWVIAAMVKISAAFFPDVAPWIVIAISVGASVLYTSLGGFRGVVITDLIQFTLGMGASILLAVLAVNSLGGIGMRSVDGVPGAGLLGALERTYATGATEVDHFLAFIPASDHPSIPPVYFFVLLIAGWWRYAEGNGYIVQRLASAKNEAHAMGASLWFTVAHNALRPWPWILVGLVALVAYPKLDAPTFEVLTVRAVVDDVVTDVTVKPASVDAAGGVVSVTGLPSSSCRAMLNERVYPIVDEKVRFDPQPAGGVFELFLRCDDVEMNPPIISAPGFTVLLGDREMAYPLLMRKHLPVGLLGLVIASLIAAFMSTIDTHTNWGASYLVNDLYRRFIAPDKDERHYVWASRISIVLMAVLAGVVASFIGNIATVWRFLIMLGAGLGSVTAARWYWSRVTPEAEFAAMTVTTVLSVYLEVTGAETLFGVANPLFFVGLPEWQKISLIAVASLGTWVPVALFGPRNDPEVLRRFAEKVRPGGPGWATVTTTKGKFARPLIGFLLGLIVVFGMLFGIGEIILGNTPLGIAMTVVGVVLIAVIVRIETTPDMKT